MKLIAPARFTRLFLFSNGLFWLIFGVFFILKSQPYEPHVKLFEEESPPYIFWSHAFPFREYMNPFMRFTRFLQWPSFYGASPLNFYFSRRGTVVDHLYGGVSIGGYYLVIVCVLSFIQWYLIGFCIDRYRKRGGHLNLHS
jgi:hypothetical protein